MLGALVIVICVQLVTTNIFILRRNLNQKDCITNSTEALSWNFGIDSDDGNENQVSKFIPEVINSTEFDCDIESGQECSSNWISKVWELSNDQMIENLAMDGFIMDRRFEKLPVLDRSNPLNYITGTIKHFKLHLSLKIYPSNQNQDYILNFISRSNSRQAAIKIRNNNASIEISRGCSKTVLLSPVLSGWKHYIFQYRNGTLSLSYLTGNGLERLVELHCENSYESENTEITTIRKNIWKVHRYKYIYTKNATNVTLGPPIKVQNGTVCVAMFIFMCLGCFIEVGLTDCSKMNVIFENMQFSKPPREWYEHKYLAHNIGIDYVCLNVNTKTLSPTPFWAIDSPRLCHEKEYRTLTVYGMKEGGACQMISNVELHKSLSFKRKRTSNDSKAERKNCPSSHTLGFDDFCVPCNWIYSNISNHDDCPPVEICIDDYCDCSSGFTGDFCEANCTFSAFKTGSCRLKPTTSQNYQYNWGNPYNVFLLAIGIIWSIIAIGVIVFIYIISSKTSCLSRYTNSFSVTYISTESKRKSKVIKRFEIFEKYVQTSIRNGELLKQFETLSINQTDSQSIAELFFVDGFMVKKAFLVLSETIKPDFFWNLLLKNNVTYVVWLQVDDDELEDEATEIWPRLDESLIFTDMSVTLEAIEIGLNYQSKTYELQHKNWNKKIFQICTNTDFLKLSVFSKNFTTLAEKLLKIRLESKSPIIIRTHKKNIGSVGVALLIDSTLRMTARYGDIKVYKNVKKLWKQIPTFTLDFESYKTIHLLILDFISNLGDSVITYNELITSPKISRNDFVIMQIFFLEEKYNEIDNYEEQIKICVNTPLYEEVPITDNFPYLTAVYVDGFQSSHKFIVTKQPEKYNLGDFWRMVVELNISLIVLLDIGNRHEKSERIICPENDCTLITSIGKIPLKLNTVQHYKNYNIALVDVTIHGKKTSVEIIVYTDWSSDKPVPNSLDTFWDLCLKTDEASVNLLGPTILMCRDGKSACGLYVALAYVVNKLKAEKICDVYQSLVTVRKNSDEFINSKSQMEFLYYAAQEYCRKFMNSKPNI